MYTEARDGLAIAIDEQVLIRCTLRGDDTQLLDGKWP
jgi:hypothetical protein